MLTVEIIPARSLRNRVTGEITSLYSAVLGDNWEVVDHGWTWGVTDFNGSYTEGLGRRPVATREEAEEVADNLVANCGYTRVN